MGTIVDARVPTGQFALAETFEDVPDASLEAVHIVASRADRQLPFFWGTATDLRSLDAALAAADSTKSTTRLVRDEDRVLYRIEWCSAVRMFVYVLVEERGTILDLAVHADAWQFRILFPDKDAMSRFYDFCKDHDVDIDISRVNGLSTVVEHGGTRLSTAQYEALSEAPGGRPWWNCPNVSASPTRRSRNASAVATTPSSNRRCTMGWHPGCPSREPFVRVTWNESERSWDCPCHGPRFDVDGTVLDTPAVEDLDTVEPAGIEPCGMGSTRKTR
jgi:hypothetical protein